MSRYTITIRPDDPAEATTKVRVDVEDGAVRIGKLTLTPGEGGGLSAQQLPAIDLSLLLQAVLPAAPALTTNDTVTPAPAADAPAPVKRATRRTATKRTASRRTATKTTPPATRAGRPYRARPDDIIDVWAQAGSVTALADHYQVPRHTAQGWISRLRAEGQIPSTK